MRRLPGGSMYAARRRARPPTVRLGHLGRVRRRVRSGGRSPQTARVRTRPEAPVDARRLGDADRSLPAPWPRASSALYRAASTSSLRNGVPTKPGSSSSRRRSPPDELDPEQLRRLPLVPGRTGEYLGEAVQPGAITRDRGLQQHQIPRLGPSRSQRDQHPQRVRAPDLVVAAQPVEVVVTRPPAEPRPPPATPPAPPSTSRRHPPDELIQHRRERLRRRRASGHVGVDRHQLVDPLGHGVRVPVRPARGGTGAERDRPLTGVRTRRAQASRMASTAGASRSVTVPETTTTTRESGSGSASAAARPYAAASTSSAQQARATSTTNNDPSPYQSIQRTRPR